MHAVTKTLLLGSLILGLGFACQKKAKPKSQERKPVSWESFATPQSSEGWGALLECLDTAKDLLVPPFRSARAPTLLGVGAPILTLAPDMSLWMKGETITIMEKDGLRSAPVPCASQTQFNGVSLCPRSISIQDRSGRLRFFDLTQDGLLEYEYSATSVPKGALPLSEKSAAHPLRQPTQDEINDVLRYLNTVFQHEPTTHHQLRNLNREGRFQSCLKAAKAYGKRKMFARVAQIQSQIQIFSSRRRKQLKSVEFSAVFSRSESGVEASLVVRNGSDKPFYLEPEPNDPCLVALSCAGQRPRAQSPMDACEPGFADAVAVAPGHSLNIGLAQVYDLPEMDSAALSRCPAVLGFYQPAKAGDEKTPFRERGL